MARNFAFQHFRGAKAGCPALNVGEFAFCTDTNQWLTGTSSGNKLVCPFPIYNSSGTLQSLAHSVIGTVTLPGGGSITITLTGAAVFTSATSYVVLAACNNAKHSPQIVQTSGTQFNIMGSGGDVYDYFCIGS